MKEGDYEVANDKRPISLLALPALSSFCERVILKQTTECMSHNKQFTIYFPSRNRKMHSTE